MEVLKRGALLLGVALIVGGCEFLREPTPLEFTDEQVMVHGVLEAGADTVAVLLTRVRPGRQGSSGPEVLPLSGVEVRITGGGSSVRLAEAPAGFGACLRARDTTGQGPRVFGLGCYAAVIPGGIRAGERYELLVGAPGGEIRGTVTVPARPVILRPDENARFVIRRESRDERGLGEVAVRWTAPASVAGIELNLVAAAVFEQGRQVPGAACRIERPVGLIYPVERGDSASVVIYNPIFCHQPTSATTERAVEQDSIHTRLLVVAYDTAYTRYATLPSGSSVQRDRFAAGITGALGVFAGAATSEQRITLVTAR
ncbi:hypothetical protein BH24GEM2_BH24GEM2_06480 [soil metagenome]|jgi:hypothetical protein|nr:DUF4249 domain-containing protein [Gemmatimonadota bacterium]